MKAIQSKNRSFALPGMGSLAVCLLCAGALAASTPQEPGEKQGGREGGSPESMPVKPRQAPAAQGDLAAELGRLQDQFNERLREVLRGADAGQHGKPIAGDLIVTMFGDDRVIAGYPVEAGSAPATPGTTGREGQTGGGASGREPEPGTPSRPGNAPGAEDAGVLLGVLVLTHPKAGGDRPANDNKPTDNKPTDNKPNDNKPIDAGAPRGGQRPSDQPGSAGGLAAGIYEVRLVGGNMLSLTGESGTVRQIPWHSAPAVRRPGDTSAGGAEGSGERHREEQGKEEQGKQKPPASTPPGSTPASTPAAGAQGNARPEWSQVFLAIVTEIAPSSKGGGAMAR